MRRFGGPKRRDKNYTSRPGVYAILPLGSKILLTHQNDPSPEFQLPGGGVDQGESPIAALHREILEETGWRIAAPLRLGVFKRFVFMPEYDIFAEKICTIYMARPIRKLGPPTECGHEAVWADAHSAAKLVESEGDQAFLMRFYPP